MLPFDYSTYETTGGTNNWAVFAVLTHDYCDSYTELGQGASGYDVLAMKFRLQELGYFTPNAGLSDSYNSTTVERVKLFQKANGLEVTGYADTNTLKKLYSQTAKANPYPL